MFLLSGKIHIFTAFIYSVASRSPVRLDLVAAYGMIHYLRNSVRCWVHELGEVHHAFPLVLGDVNALYGREARVGVPEVLQLELPLRQTGASQLHKHLPRHTNTEPLPLTTRLEAETALTPL